MPDNHSDGSRPLRVGIIGAGEVSQVIHLPTLTLLHDRYEVVALCDVSRAAVEHVGRKFHVPHLYTRSTELVARDDIDLVVVASADEYHCTHVVQAADAGKHVLVEKPMALTRAESEQIEAARVRNGVHVVVAYMRRYTPVFAVFMDELRRAGPVAFARVFDYSGPNATFVGQSSTQPQVFVADVGEETRTEKEALAQAIAHTALGDGRARDPRLVKAFRLLGSLGSHDISCLRHCFGGVPDVCTAAFVSPDANFIGATFIYNRQPDDDGGRDPAPFQVSYETGIHDIGTFDAYIEVYCQRAVVKLKYDTPYVKGLPIFVSVRQNTGADGRGYEERTIRPTFVDAYSAEFVRLFGALQLPVSKEPSAEVLRRQGWGECVEMCGPGDSLKDLEIFDMIMAHVK